MTALALSALLSLAQVEVFLPGAKGTGPGGLQSAYGEPLPVELASLASGTHLTRTVRTRGTLGYIEPGDAFYELSEGSDRVLVILVPELRRQVGILLGRRVEVVGLVRSVVEDQGTCRIPGPAGPQQVPATYCDDPQLPPTPDRVGERATWPRVSITAWSITDSSPSAGRGTPASADESALDLPPATKVTVVGRFRGANLEADLPGAPPAAGAWVLTVGTRAVWVIGRRPEGRGFKLDPAYRGDLGRWLEVAGRLTACAAGTCLKASGVVLATPPITDP